MVWTYLNNDFIKKDEVRISPFDRGFLFGDGVYEVIPVYDHKSFLLDDHIDRLARSLFLTKINKPKVWKNIPQIIDKLVKKNNFNNQSVYLQITRGVDSTRSHIPENNVEPTLFITSSELKVNPFRINPERNRLEMDLIEDPRWDRCDVKSVILLPNVLAMNEAVKEGKDGVLFYKEGNITEGASFNVFAVFDNLVITTPESKRILSGVTRKHIINILNKKKVKVLEGQLELKKIFEADEVWITSSTQEIQPVGKIEDKELVFKPTHESLWFDILKIYFESELKIKS